MLLKPLSKKKKAVNTSFFIWNSHINVPCQHNFIHLNLHKIELSAFSFTCCLLGNRWSQITKIRIFVSTLNSEWLKYSAPHQLKGLRSLHPCCLPCMKRRTNRTQSEQIILVYLCFSVPLSIDRMRLLPCNILSEIFASGLSVSEICYIFWFCSGRGKCVWISGCR